MESDDAGIQKKITRIVFWIWIAINNIIAGTLLGMTFLTGPSVSFSESEIYLRLVIAVLIISLIFSFITVGLTALFKKPGILRGYSYPKVFLIQLALLLIGYIVVDAIVYFFFKLYTFSKKYITESRTGFSKSPGNQPSKTSNN